MEDLTAITRKEKYLAKAGGQDVELPLPPITRKEKYIKGIVDEGGGGGFTPTQMQLDAMNSGIDSTKVAQIATNADAIANAESKIYDILDELDTKLPDKGNHTTINGIDVYVSATQPTGDIAEGSIGFGW